MVEKPRIELNETGRCPVIAPPDRRFIACERSQTLPYSTSVFRIAKAFPKHRAVDEVVRTEQSCIKISYLGRRKFNLRQ